MQFDSRFGPGSLARHQRRPRLQVGFAALTEHEGMVVGASLLAHERRAFGVATLDIATLALHVDQEAAREGLLAVAVEAAANAGLPFLMLHGASADYGQYGLVPCRILHRIALPPPSAVAPLLRPVTPADADDLAALAAANQAGLALAAVRAPPDWRWLLADAQGWLALEDGRGRLSAYALLEGVTVSEAGAADAGAARMLVAALAAHGASELALPVGHSVARAALMLGGTARLSAATLDQPTELWGVIDLFAALEAIGPELNRRLAQSRYAGWRGTLRLEGEAGAAALRCGAEGIVVEAAAGPLEVMVGGVGLSAAVQLILGYRAAADLRATGELRCADVDLGLIDALFPALS